MTMNKSEIRHYDDLSCSIVIEETTNDAYCSFVVYHHIGKDKESGARLYQKAGSTYSPNFEEDIEKAEKLFSATIKWDGCSDWDVNENHFCGRSDLHLFHKIMDKLYDLTKELISVDEECFEGGMR